MDLRKGDRVDKQSEGHWFKSLDSPDAYWSILEQDTEPQISPDDQMAPCMAASAISLTAATAAFRRWYSGDILPRYVSDR